MSLILHAATAGLVVLLARELIGREGWPTLVAGLLFAVHPIHTEVVAWISGIMDVSCTFFSLLALWLYIRSDGGQRRRMFFTISLSALFLGLLSKEPAAAVPVLLVAYDVLFRGERLRSMPDIARRWGPPFGVFFVYLALRAVALGGLAPFRTGTSAGLGTAIANVPILFSLYIQKLVWPIGLNVVHDIQPAASWMSREALAGLAVVTLCLGLAIVVARIERRALFGILVFVLPLTPALYVPALSQDVSKAFAERYAYFPSVGFALIVAATLARCAQRSVRWYPRAVAAGLVVAGLFAGLTVARNPVWSDSFTLWSDCVQKSPNLALAHESLALALIRRGQAEEGKRELQIAVRLDPTLPKQSLASGVLAARRGQFLQAILAFQTALAYQPDLVDAHYNLVSRVENSFAKS